MTTYYRCITVFLALFFIFFSVFLTAPAMAEPYVISDIQVDVKAENAIKARNQAFEKAQVEAFTKLAAQFLPPSEMATYKPPAASVIGPMVQDFEVTQEKLSSRRYIGTYTFRFRERAVQRHFPQGQSVATADVTPPENMPDTNQSENSASQTSIAPTQSSLSNPVPAARPSGILILPVLQRGSQNLLWSPVNTWLRAWQQSPASTGQAVPMGDLADVRDINDQNVFQYDMDALARLRERYGMADAAIAKANIMEDPATRQRTIIVDIYRTDRMDGPEQAGRIRVPVVDGETEADGMARAIAMVRSTLRTDWKNAVPPQAMKSNPIPQMVENYAASTSVHSGGSNLIDVIIPIKSLQEWTSAQRELVRTPGVNEVILRTLTPRQARISVSFRGDDAALRAALAGRGLSLSQENPGQGYNLDRAMPVPAPAPASAPVSRSMPIPQAPSQSPYAAQF